MVYLQRQAESSLEAFAAMRTIQEIDSEIDRANHELSEAKKLAEKVDVKIKNLKIKIGKLGDERAATQTIDLI